MRRLIAGCVAVAGLLGLPGAAAAQVSFGVDRYGYFRGGYDPYVSYYAPAAYYAPSTYYARSAYYSPTTSYYYPTTGYYQPTYYSSPGYVMAYSSPRVYAYSPSAVYVSPYRSYYAPVESYSWTPVRRSYYVAPVVTPVYQSSYEPSPWVWCP